jgi:tRNA dimethylallyltransferase
MDRVTAIIGPTGTGKTELALALAQGTQHEIVGADSRQIYRQMDIGTAKPTIRQQTQVPHHLIDIVNPDEDFNLSLYLTEARKIVSSLFEQGKGAIVVGGTGQYISALLEGWNIPNIPPNIPLRKELEEKARIDGPTPLLKELRSLDADAAKKVDHKNARRIIRAIEVAKTPESQKGNTARKTDPPWPFTVIGLTMEREKLYSRLDRRVDQMIQSGWVREIKDLLEYGFSTSLPAFSSAGYREIANHIRNLTSLEEATKLTKYSHHKLARRQYTWFRKRAQKIHWLDATDRATPLLAEEARSVIHSTK